MDETNNIPNDVNTQPDTSTDGGSSPAEETPVVETETTNSTPAETTGDKAVPYERFKEVNDNFRQTQAELKAIREQQTQIAQSLAPKAPAPAPEVAQAREQLKGLLKDLAPELGFVSKQEIQQQEAVKAVDTTHTRLEGKYNGKDGLPKYDRQAVLNHAIDMGFQNEKGLEVAYKDMHDAEIMNARIAKALQQSRGVQSESSNGTGSANTGVSNDDLLKAAQEGDKNATHLLLKRRLSGK